ncbi:MAG TPA: hypothetical protein P5185_09335 [Oscillospiraceae bacterium]|nr:hypothetical protein [Oscillospiraceae bacterium]
MRVTCDHSASSYGIPVILDDDGAVMDYAAGLTAVLQRLGWSRERAAIAAGYKSARSIEKFWQGVPPSAQLLNVLALELVRGGN